MKKIPATIALFGIALISLPAQAQIPLQPQHYRIFDKDGKPATLAGIIESCKDADVLFLGEEHNDAVGHALQAQIFKQLIARYKASRNIALSLEMFERDTQIVLDEFLNGQITERHFLSSSRPWSNYEQDYKPLVMQAKTNKIPVIAANAPRRYVNMVSRHGRESLDGLSAQAKTWLAPLPFAKASPAYAKKLNALMGGAAHSGGFADSQALWDATMANSIAKFLQSASNPLVVQLNGKFHSESHLGTVEHLKIYHAATKAVVVTVFSDSSFPSFDKKSQQGLGDFVVLTDPKVERSYKQ